MEYMMINGFYKTIKIKTKYNKPCHNKDTTVRQGFARVFGINMQGVNLAYLHLGMSIIGILAV